MRFQINDIVKIASKVNLHGAMDKYYPRGVEGRVISINATGVYKVKVIFNDVLYGSSNNKNSTLDEDELKLVRRSL